MSVMHSLDRESAQISVDTSACKQCGACAKIRPAEVLAMEDDTVRAISPDDVVPPAASEERAGADELEALMRSRRSVRRFSDREMEPDLLRRIVDMTATAPMGTDPALPRRQLDRQVRHGGELVRHGGRIAPEAHQQ